VKQEIDREFTAICRRNNWKCTIQRRAVYGFMRGNLSHPGVDTVWNHVRETAPTVTRESVYRILNEFSQCGILNRLDHIENARYDSRTDSHGHFVCEQCGTIIDFDLSQKMTVPDDAVKGEIRQIELRISGICSKCR